MAPDVGRVRRDRISDLPDCILITILSLLPTYEAARSTALASRWRRLFPQTLADFKVVTPHRAIITGRARSLSTTGLCFPSFGADPSVNHVDGLLQDLADRGVHELSLCFSFSPSPMRESIPATLFACASLTRLCLIRAIFPEVAADNAAAPFSRLKEIDLFDVTISEDTLNFLLSQCTVLESLTARFVSKCGRALVRSRSLKVLRTCGNFDELVVEDAPNLEVLLGDHMYMRPVHLKVAHAPKLEFLGYLGMSFRGMEIVDSMLKKDKFHVRTLMPSLKTLAVEVSYITEGYIDWFLQLLTLFPCLETLYIKSDTWSKVRSAAPGSWEAEGSVPPCIDNHLEKVVFQVYRGHEWQREMARFLHGRSRFLKTMEFHCMDDTGRADYGKPPSESWVRRQQELLCVDGRASRDAHVLFFKGQLADNHQHCCNDEEYQTKYYDHLYEV